MNPATRQTPSAFQRRRSGASSIRHPYPQG
jgi:hypothetical protein